MGRSQIHLHALASLWDSDGGYEGGELRAGLVINDEENADDFFRQLEGEKEAVGLYPDHLCRGQPLVP
jgi:hypothetical protein